MAQISDPLERKYLVQDLLNDPESDEEGGAKERVESDSDVGNSEEELDEDQGASKGLDLEAPPEKEWQKLMSTHRKKHNTGPKGVKADYEEAKRIVKRLNETKMLMRREALKAANGVTTNEPSVSYSAHKALKKVCFTSVS